MPEANGLIAVNVAFLLPEWLGSIVRSMNRRLWEAERKLYLMDESHIPHLSLLHMFARKDELSRLAGAVEDIALGTAPLTLRVTRMKSEDNETGLFHALAIQDNAALWGLHRLVLGKLEGFASETGSSDSFLRDQGEESAIKSVASLEQYREKRTGDKFAPHITVGIGPDVPFTGPFVFRASSLALCHLGHHGSCRRVLSAWDLQDALP